MHYPKPATMRRRLRGLALLPLVLTAAAACGMPSQPAAADEPGAVAEKYVGRWNYDQPDLATMTNFATSNVPGRSQVPTIGDVVFTADGPDRIVGRTDVGCTWRFAASPESLELDPPSQLCHNPTSNVAYTISRWSVTVEGDRMTETIISKSHRPDRDYDFVLDNGARTKVAEYDPEAAAKFVGTWAYAPADPEAGVNIRTVRTMAGGTPSVDRSPEQGAVEITRADGSRIIARTDNGCAWSLSARGNTAKLDPPVQTCTLATSTAITMESWTITTDGTRQVSVMTGTDEHGADFVLTEGNLSKR